MSVLTNGDDYRVFSNDQSIVSNWWTITSDTSQQFVTIKFIYVLPDRFASLIYCNECGYDLDRQDPSKCIDLKAGMYELADDPRYQAWNNKNGTLLVKPSPTLKNLEYRLYENSYLTSATSNVPNPNNYKIVSQNNQPCYTKDTISSVYILPFDILEGKPTCTAFDVPNNW
jgi:hypothetical protein